MTPWFDIRCDTCPNRDSVQRAELAFDQDAGACTAGEPEPTIEPHDGCPDDCAGCACHLSPPCSHCVDHHPIGCEGRMRRAMTAPAIGKGSSGEPLRPASG